ncbi:MAG TPA: hypothetical protein VGF32_04900 [Streptosporangiaceae bacterium]
MTSTAATLRTIPRSARQRITRRLAELRDLDRLMREPGTLATPPPDSPASTRSRP